MYLVNQTSKKNHEVSFYQDGGFEAYQRKMYEKKWVHEHTITDGNTQRMIYVWPSEEAYQRWYDDPTVTKFREAREKHNASAAISFNEVKAFV